MRKFKLLILILFSAFGLFFQGTDINAQTPPSLNCPNVTVTFASSAAYAPLTSSGTGAPRICLPQCSTSVATCTTSQATTISATFSGAGLGTITNRVWSTEGNIAINGATNGTTVSIYSTVSNTAPFQYGKGRLKLTYTNSTGVCGCVGFVTLDVFKTVKPLPTNKIIGPTCVSIGEDVAYSIAPDFSRNASLGIGIDNNYSWGSVTGFSSTPPTNYTSGDNSSQTYRVTSAPTGLQSVTVKPGHNTTAGAPTIPGTGCNNHQVTLGPIKRKAAGFNLTVTPAVISGYTIGGNTSNLVTACIDGGITTPCTLSVPLASQEAGVTYTFSSSSATVGIAPNPLDPTYSVIVTPGATGSAVISCLGSILNGCGTASSTYTITRKVAPASTFTRFSTNFPAPVAGVYCLRKNTAYTFQLSGGTNVPPNVVSAGNAGLPTALGTWSWAPGSNIMTLTTPSTSGTATAYTVGLNNITCAGGNINVPDQYRLATDQPYTFAITPAVTNCGNFQVRATGFPITCPNALFYTWSVSPGSVVIVGIPSGCGVQNVQIDPTTVPVGGCTISCTVSATGCIIPGTCTVCQNFIVTNPTPFIVPNNSQPYLAGCRPGPGGENPKSALRAATDPDFEIDPNPTSVSLSVKLNSGKNQESTVSITDVSGKQVLSATKDSDEFTLDVSSLSKGVYIISINNSNGLKTKRFVKN